MSVDTKQVIQKQSSTTKNKFNQYSKHSSKYKSIEPNKRDWRNREEN